jgi:cytochrome c peroxidase
VWSRSVKTTMPLLIPAVLFAVLSGCSSTGDYDPVILELPADPAEYDPIASYDYMEIPADNPITPEKAALGRQLYYDYRLSGDNSRSCYHCHLVQYGLTDGQPLAVGAYNKKLTRNAPTMWNVGYYENLYWDGRASSLEKQAVGAWTGGNMGAKDTGVILDELNAINGYAEQFDDIFGEPATQENVAKALATYMRTIISATTQWDDFMAGKANAMSDQQERGWAVIQAAGCIECHAGALFTDQQFHNVGIGMDAEKPDVGRFKITELEQDMGAFRTPTLRDITRTAPYFHDGSVATLEEAVRLMVAGGIPNANLSPKLKPADLTEDEINDLIVFLSALQQNTTMAVFEPPVLPR